jgi:histone-lysine N-methyltransferase SETMAR
MDASDENLRFYVFVESARGVTPKNIIEQLRTVYKDAAPSKTFVYKWHKEFTSGQRQSLQDLPRFGRPISQRTDKNISRVFDFVETKPKTNLACIAESLNLSKETVRRILVEDLLFHKVCSVWVPHRLSDTNKVQRVNCAQSLLQLFNQYSLDELCRLFATQDETWIPFDLGGCKEDNKVWIAPQTPRPRVLRPQLTFRKTMLSIVFTGNKKVHADVTLNGETVDSESFIAFVHKTGELWRMLRTDPTHLKDLLWMHDNARPHTSAATREFMDRRKVTLVVQSPYSPDLNLCDRWLFKEIKKILKSYSMNSAQDVFAAVLNVFHSIPLERFQQEIKKLEDHCHRVILGHGDYITK